MAWALQSAVKEIAATMAWLTLIGKNHQPLVIHGRVHLLFGVLARILHAKIVCAALRLQGGKHPAKRKGEPELIFIREIT